MQAVAPPSRSGAPAARPREAARPHTRDAQATNGVLEDKEQRMDVLLARQLNLISFLLGARGQGADAVASDSLPTTERSSAEAEAHGAQRAFE